MLDEERERELFQAAVMEWRKAAVVPSNNSPRPASGMWSNPVYDEADISIATSSLEDGKTGLANGFLNEEREHEVLLRAST